jgi:hypothetical protein
MPIKIPYDYAEYIRQNKKSRCYVKIAALVRKGDISDLDQEALHLLADYLNDPKKIGRPRKDNMLLSESLHGKLECIKQYGMTSSELNEYFKNATNENFKALREALKTNQKKRNEAIEHLAEKENLSFKQVEKLTDSWSVCLHNQEKETAGD